MEWSKGNQQWANTVKRFEPTGWSSRMLFFAEELIDDHLVALSLDRYRSNLVAISAKGTWCERQKPSVFRPSTCFGPVQPLGVRKDHHRPAGMFGGAIGAGLVLNIFNLRKHGIQGFCHQLMHVVGLIPFDKIGRIPVAYEQAWLAAVFLESALGMVTPTTTY